MIKRCKLDRIGVKYITVKLLSAVVCVALAVGLVACSSRKPVRMLPSMYVPAQEFKRDLAMHRLGQVNPHARVRQRIEQAQLNGHGDQHQPYESRGRLGQEQAVRDMGSKRNLIPVALRTNSRYKSPLDIGNPGQNASLWSSDSAENNFFRDIRAWKPMDVLTIIIDESSEGTSESETDIKSKSTTEGGITNLLGILERLENNHDFTASKLINAETNNKYKGEGDVSRKDELKGSISAVVVEVLPSGILRIEGTKIISVNNEEQTMVISGLVRSRDIDSDNTVHSSRIANLRIDYFGRGQSSDAQREGWFARTMRSIWPF